MISSLLADDNLEFIQRFSIFMRTEKKDEEIKFEMKIMRKLTRRASIGNTKSVGDKTILFGPFDSRFFSK